MSDDAATNGLTPSDAASAPTTHQDLMAADAAALAKDQAPYRAALSLLIKGVSLLTVVSVPAAWFIAEGPGVWAALLGIAVTIIFAAPTVLTVMYTVRSAPQVMAGVILGSWLVKMIVLFILLLLIRDAEFYDRIIFVVVLGVGVIGAAILDARAVVKSRVPYVVPQDQ